MSDRYRADLNKTVQLQTGVVPATVTIGTVTPDDYNAKFEADDEGVFTDYEIINRLEDNPHIYMMGITSPNGFQTKSVAFVQLAAPTLLWICEWTAERYGEIPKIPTATPKEGLVLLGRIPETKMVRVGPDGVTGIYRLSGTYIYGFESPPDDPWDETCFGRPPWLDDSLARQIPTERFVTNLIDCTGEQTGPQEGFPDEGGENVDNGQD